MKDQTKLSTAQLKKIIKEEIIRFFLESNKKQIKELRINADNLDKHFRPRPEGGISSRLFGRKGNVYDEQIEAIEPFVKNWMKQNRHKYGVFSEYYAYIEWAKKYHSRLPKEIEQKLQKYDNVWDDYVEWFQTSDHVWKKDPDRYPVGWNRKDSETGKRDEIPGRSDSENRRKRWPGSNL